MRRLRAEQRPSGLRRWALAAWMALSRRPGLYRHATQWALTLLALGKRRGRLRRLPGFGAWTATRELPTPATQTFQRQWRAKHRPGSA